MKRLALKLPTVLQTDASHVIFFHNTGVSEFEYLSNHPTFNALELTLPSRLWALVDTNTHLSQPAGIFRSGSLFFVVDAVSPGSEKFKWLNKIKHSRFYMSPWSILEVIQAYVDLAFEGSQLSPPAVVLSSVIRSTQNISSGICTLNLAHLPGP